VKVLLQKIISRKFENFSISYKMDKKLLFINLTYRH